MTESAVRRPPASVLWVIRGLGMGGAERLLVDVARVTDPAVARFRVLYQVPEKDHLVGALEDLGVPSRLLPGMSRPAGLVRTLRSQMAHDVDVVHVHSPALAAPARVAARSLGRRRPALMYTEHNEWSAYGPATRWLNAVTLPLDDHHVAVSTAVRDSVRPARSRSTMPVLVHGVDVPSFRADPERRRTARARVSAALGLAPDTTVLITVANLRYHKGYPDLLAAMQKVAARRPRTHLLVVGQGPLDSWLRAAVQDLGLTNVVHVLGARDDVADLLAASDLFVLASHWEGYPLALMEAMAAGLPVVATSVGGVPDAVRDGAGMLVPPRRPDLLAQRVLEVLGDPVTLARMAAAAAEQASAFDIRDVAARLGREYVRMAAQRRRPAAR